MSAITLVVGLPNSGKTTEMIRMYAALPPGSAQGVVQTKTFDCNAQHNGFSLRNLADSMAYPLIVLTDPDQSCPKGWFTYNRFLFCDATFQIGIDLLNEACFDSLIKTILIDEVGPIEALGKGYDSALRNVLRSSKDVILSVSNAHLDQILETYDIHPVQQIQIE